LMLVRTRTCPLSMRAVWTYSHLVYRSRLNWGATQRELEEVTGLHHQTVSKVLTELKQCELVELKDGLYCACDDKNRHFYRKQATNIPDWQDRYQTVTVYLRAPTQSTLTFTENLVVWLVHSYNLQGKKIRRRGCATQLHISVTTAKRTLKRLRSIGLIDDQWNLTLTEEAKTLWADVPEKDVEERNAAARDNFLLAINVIKQFPEGYVPQFQEFAKTRDHLKEMFTLLRTADYTSHQVEQFFLKELPAMCGIEHDNGTLPYLCLDAYLNRCVAQVFRLAEQITDDNRRRRRFAGRNSLGIFRTISIGVIRFERAWVLEYGAEGIQNMTPSFEKIAAQWMKK
jgi:DNA-binding transcriptional regulator YhcF (GntR family)